MGDQHVLEFVQARVRTPLVAGIPACLEGIVVHDPAASEQAGQRPTLVACGISPVRIVLHHMG